MIVNLLLLISAVGSIANAQINIVLDPTKSPPASFPADKDLIYSVSVGQRISQPIQGTIKNGSTNVLDETGEVAFKIESIDVDVHNNVVSATDTWKSSGGQLCQWSYNAKYPIRRDRRFAEFQCGNTTSGTSTTLDNNLFAFQGLIIAEALYHSHPNGDAPPRNRVFKISITVDNVIYSVVTNPVKVTVPAASLALQAAPSPSIQANTAFSLTALIKDKAGATITSGIDSTLFVTLSVGWEYKQFYHQIGKEMFLRTTQFRLDGDEARVHASYYDTIIRKRAVNGVVTFSNIRILDTGSVKLNFTMTVPRDPWIRQPNNYTDLECKVVSGNYFTYNATTDCSPNSAILMSPAITVTPQSASTLNLLTTASTIHTYIGANMPMTPDVVVEVRDSAGNRIYSGLDSMLNITTTIAPTTECLSVDSKFQLKDGQGTFPGSVCEPGTGIQLSFQTVSVVTPGATITCGPLPALNVTDEIHIANYIDYYTSGSSSDPQPHLDAFTKFAANDINNDVFPDLLKNRTLIVHSYNTWNDVTKTVKAYRKMIDDGKANPSEKIRAMIGFGHNHLTEKLTPLLNADKMPLLATREDKLEFGDKEIYPYYNRLSWHEGATTHSVLLAFKQRKWKKVTIIRAAGYELGQVLYDKAKANDITILGEVTIPVVPETDWGRGALAEEMQKVKNLGTRIIMLYVPAKLMYLVLREAYHAGMSCNHGYQWVTLGIFTWSFPWANQHAICYQTPICTVAYTGLHAFTPTYSVSAYSTQDWLRVMGYHMYSDRSIYKGRVKYVIYEVGAEMALGYDAVRVYAMAMHQLIQDKKTISGEGLSLQVRQVEFDGLTGRILFNNKGDRPGFLGSLVTVNPIPPQLGVMPTNVAIFSRNIQMEDEYATDQLEIPFEAYWPLYLPPYNYVIGQMGYPNTTFTNKRYFNSTSGMYARETQTIVAIPPSSDIPAPMVREEDVVAPFYCTNGCGGNAVDPTDITLYQFGECIAQDTCQCIDGYFTDTCDRMICSCKNGRCDIPQVCICDAGWEGSECDSAICIPSCVNGRCVGPNECECDAGYIGGVCDTTLAVVIILPLMAAIAIGIGLFFLIRYVSRVQARNAALKSLDWLVKWDEVEGADRAMSLMSTASDAGAGQISNNCITWRHQKCFAQPFNIDSLDVGDEAIRLEMVILKEIRHTNLITFVGACFDAPNCCLVTELAPKGSLEDLLSNESVKLGWDFRYSILKDICRGMDFLHRSELGSHGRLKSSNCLVDNRWSCKISGFGAPTLRYLAPRLVDAETDEQFKPSTLYWTAPEFLSTCKTVADVGCGSKAGDIYAYGIILTEMCTREQPYTREIQDLEAMDIIHLVQDKNNPNYKKQKMIWSDMGVDTNKPFRPSVPDDTISDDYEVCRKMKLLMDECWCDNPEDRPTYRHILEQLNIIHPVKGELIDNLVNMLEKYSSNLEAIVADRTKDLILEKAKTEQLISQMLPKKVVEDLKHGRKVLPEAFECVTIFFSDIVGFTAIARDSTPFQVVDLLNDLYTTFDAILDNYDVYKVETIGDAYMVVSGLPIRNGKLHAGEIATMSLDLLSSMVGFKIRHQEGVMLQLRVGMHSGPCVAGVVGLKMPRYCLFGDTVNTASRMESSSVALKIHMSGKTADILMELGGYILDCRGEREVKGKGIMTTYWLDGKDGYDKPLPTKEMAVSLSQHEFK